MTVLEPMPETVPEPGALVALVKQLAECVWPESDEQRAGLFRELGFESGAEFEPDRKASNTKHFALFTSQPGDMFASWSSFMGRFMGVTLQPYTVMEPASAISRRGHDEIQRQLTALYGEPVRPWGEEEIPPSIWQANGRDIMMHFFHRRDSSVMLSIDDSELAAAAEAEAVDRQDHHPEP